MTTSPHTPQAGVTDGAMKVLRCHERLRIEVIGDWSRSARGNFWLEVLSDMNKKRLIKNEAHLYRLGDWVRHPAPGITRKGLTRVPPRSLLELLPERDVLIVNWDVANGDPDFGADKGLRWLSQRSPDILAWVHEQGGLLLIEGQTRLGSPTQATYDALLGGPDVRVSGAPDSVHPRANTARKGTRCKLTKQAHKQEYFAHLMGFKAGQQSFDELFPGKAGKMLSPILAVGDPHWLYRGWFQWNPMESTRLRWVPFVETDKRKFDHPTMLVARHGSGAVFVSTMNLVSSGQVALIHAILRCHGNSHRLPVQPKPITFLKSRGVETLVPLAAAAAAGSSAFGLGLDEVIGSGVLTVLYSTLFGAAVLAAIEGSSWIRRTYRDIRGR